MRLYFFISILLFSSFKLSAQTKKLDSLLSEYTEIRSTAPDSVLGRVLLEIGKEYEGLQQHDNAKNYYRQVVRSLVGKGLAEIRFDAFKQLGTIGLLQGEYKEALKYYESCYELALTLKDSVKLGSAFHNLAIVYSGMSNFPQALEYYQKALDIQQKQGNRRREAYTIGSIGSIFNAMGETKKAMNYYHDALKILEEIDDKGGISIFSTHLASIHKQNKNYSIALQLYQRALSIQETVNNLEVIASCYSEMGDVYAAVRNYSKATLFYHKSLSVLNEMGNEADQVAATSGLSKVHQAQNQLDSALYYARKGVFISDKHTSAFDRKNAHLVLSEVYEKIKEYDKALKHYKIHIDIKDSVFNDQNSLRLARLESEFNFDKERERLMLEKERNELAYELRIKQANAVRNVILAGLFIGLVIGIFIYRNYRARGKVNSMLKERNARISEQNKKITKQNDELNYTNMQLIEARMDMLEALDNERKAHESLKQAEKQLVQSEKMASLGQLTAGIAHEINNPLNYITGSIQVLEENLKILDTHLSDLLSAQSEEEKRKLQDEITLLLEEDELLHDMRQILPSVEEGAERIRKIVESLKVFAAEGGETMQNGNIHTDIDATIALLGSTWKDNIQVKTYYDQNVPNFYAYHGLLNQMLLQLFTNSIDAIEGEGEIRIYTELIDKELEIRIQDTGTGIPDDVQDRIFDPFYTTKDVGKGSGLGLAQVYSIVQKHEGNIKFTTTENMGTTFFIRLPIEQ